MKIRAFIKNNQAESFLADFMKLGLFAPLIILLFIGGFLIVAAYISLIWGGFGFLGFGLLCAAAFILVIKRGNVTFKRNSVFMWVLLFGISFMILAFIPGLEVYHVDLSFLSFMKTHSMNVFGSPPSVLL